MFNYRINKKSEEFLMFDGNLLANRHLVIKKEYIRITHDKYMQSLLDNNVIFQYNFMSGKKIDTNIKKTHFDINKVYNDKIAELPNMTKVELCKGLCYYNSVLLLLDNKPFSFIDIRYKHILENSLIMADKNDAPIVLCHESMEYPFAVLMPIVAKQTTDFIDIIKELI